MEVIFQLFGTKECYMSEKGLKMLVSKGKILELKNMEVGLSWTVCAQEAEKSYFWKIKEDTQGWDSRASSYKYVWANISLFIRRIALLCHLFWWLYYEGVVLFLKHKYDVFVTLNNWKATFENEIDLIIKCLKSDNGG